MLFSLTNNHKRLNSARNDYIITYLANTMNMNFVTRSAVLVLGLLLPACTAFSPVLPTSASRHHVQRSVISVDGHTALNACKMEDIEDIGYTVKVQKPLGVVFGENQAPYDGLRAEEIEEASEGERVGIKFGDQLLAVNGDICIGNGFDSAMSLLRNSPNEMELLLYNGPAKNLYKILTNRNVELESDDDEELPVMDENYESPVQVDVTEQRGFDFGKAVSMLTGGGDDGETKKEQKEGAASSSGGKKGGLFGMFSQETIQLEGEDATGTGKNR
jgi:hypothetical protein